MEMPKSACCNADIDSKRNSFDWCVNCGGSIHYALMNTFWASAEACAVYEDFNGKRWFFWQQVCSWTLVQESLSENQFYLGQIKTVIASITARYNRDGDLFSREENLRFLREFEKQVENPEIIRLLGK